MKFLTTVLLAAALAASATAAQKHPANHLIHLKPEAEHQVLLRG
jgi:hypothetical protein